jgi:hypothetical protein
LVNLRRLIIQRDNYPLRPDQRVGASWVAQETGILEHAAAYVRILPRLEFILIGQVLLTSADNNSVREPVVSRSARPAQSYGVNNLLRDDVGMQW